MKVVFSGCTYDLYRNCGSSQHYYSARLVDIGVCGSIHYIVHSYNISGGSDVHVSLWINTATVVFPGS